MYSYPKKSQSLITSSWLMHHVASYDTFMGIKWAIIVFVFREYQKKSCLARPNGITSDTAVISRIPNRSVWYDCCCWRLQWVFFVSDLLLVADAIRKTEGGSWSFSFPLSLKASCAVHTEISYLPRQTESTDVICC